MACRLYNMPPGVPQLARRGGRAHRPTIGPAIPATALAERRRRLGLCERNKKRAAAWRPPFVSSLEKDYLLILRRRTIASAPRPSRLIVAGSGTGAVLWMSPFTVTAVSRRMPPPEAKAAVPDWFSVPT